MTLLVAQVYECDSVVIITESVIALAMIVIIVTGYSILRVPLPGANTEYRGIAVGYRL